MKRLLYTVTAILALATLLIAAPEKEVGGSAPAYTADGKLIPPKNYREWIYLSTGLGMNYGPSARAGSMFTNVFVNPESYREFKQTGKWPDKTTFALEIYSPATHSQPNAAGQFQDMLVALEAEVKDTSTPEVWRYYDLMDGSAPAAALPKGAGCFACHEENAAVEHSFAQFYPQILAIATEKGTLKPGVTIPLNAARFRDLLLSKGWADAEAAYRRDKQENPHAALDEPSLNRLGYQLLNAKHPAVAVQVLELVTRDWPTSANAYDSLADAYVAAGRTADAIAASQKVLTLLSADTAMAKDRKDIIASSAKDRLATLQPKK